MKKEITRLLVVDDNAAVRRALVLRLTRARDIRIIGDTGDLDIANAIVIEQQPDVVIVESKRRDGQGLAFCQAILETRNAPKIAILTSFASEDERLSLLHLGIGQYLLKDIHTEELIRVVQALANNVEINTR
jgi:DNA-binding NarL/FixJ family response regulator